MKNLIFTFGLFSIFFFSCTKSTDESSINGSWTVESFRHLTTKATEYKTKENSWNSDITIQFNATANPSTFSGINTTNQIFGEFSLVGQKELKILNLVTTEKTQPKWADEFLTVIDDSNLTYSVKNDKLIIVNGTINKSVTLKRN